MELDQRFVVILIFGLEVAVLVSVKTMLAVNSYTDGVTRGRRRDDLHIMTENTYVSVATNTSKIDDHDTKEQRGALKKVAKRV